MLKLTVEVDSKKKKDALDILKEISPDALEAMAKKVSKANWEKIAKKVVNDPKLLNMLLSQL